MRTIERVCEIPHEGSFCDLMWSDPEEIDTWCVLLRAHYATPAVHLPGTLSHTRAPVQWHMYHIVNIMLCYSSMICLQGDYMINEPAALSCAGLSVRGAQAGFLEVG